MEGDRQSRPKNIKPTASLSFANNGQNESRKDLLSFDDSASSLP